MPKKLDTQHSCSPLKGEGSPFFSICSTAVFHGTFENISLPLQKQLKNEIF